MIVKHGRCFPIEKLLFPLCKQGFPMKGFITNVCTNIKHIIKSRIHQQRHKCFNKNTSPAALIALIENANIFRVDSQLAGESSASLARTRVFAIFPLTSAQRKKKQKHSSRRCCAHLKIAHTHGFLWQISLPFVRAPYQKPFQEKTQSPRA